MPGRIALGTAAWWEPVAAVGLALLAIAGLVLFAGRVYSGAVLHSGAALKLRDAWRRTAVPGASIHAPAAARWVRIGSIVGPVLVGVVAAVILGDVVMGVIVGVGLVALAGRLVKVRSARGPA
jgi:hypothetical protein